MRIAIAVLVMMAGCAWGQDKNYVYVTGTPRLPADQAAGMLVYSKDGSISENKDPIMVCTSAVFDGAKEPSFVGCSMLPGHTLDELVNVLMGAAQADNTRLRKQYSDLLKKYQDEIAAQIRAIEQIQKTLNQRK